MPSRDPSDLIGTISSDDDISEEEEAEAEAEAEEEAAAAEDERETSPRKRKRARARTRAERASEPALHKKRRTGDDAEKASDLESDFEFENEAGAGGAGAGEEYDVWGRAAGAGREVDGVEAIIWRRKQERRSRGGIGEREREEDGMEEDGVEDEEDDEDEGEEDGLGEDGAEEEEGEGEEEEFHTAIEDVQDEEDEEDEDGAGSADEESDDEVAVHVPHPDDDVSVSGSEIETDAAAEEEKRLAFFAADSADATSTSSAAAFHSMNLSRPILKGLASVGFNKPTPIQQKTIPVALEGKDLVGGAVTGSGKTAAFLIPILERLLFRPKRTPTTRVAILMPTRELALQCFGVAKKLAAFTDITFGQAIGGLNSREQEKQLKLRPDVVIATPGRFIDLERNSASFSVSTVEILVLDEADRMLEEGFADELNEILDKIPRSRQTMLFSATMTSKVDDLIRAGLQRPVRLLVDAQSATVSGLVQEFVRLRAGREQKRLAYLMQLCSSVYTDRVIIFFRQKKEAHRVRVIFALCGLAAAELHGSMSQDQRIRAIEAFRTGSAAFLLATDLASRGLDIKGIATVINYEAPQSHEIYLHRVGRTARAGRSGRSCTLAAEPDRKVVKAAVKAAREQGAQIRQRAVDAADVDAWHARLAALAEEVESVLREEREQRALQQVDRDLSRADNLVLFHDEISSRPKKTWFASARDKQLARSKGNAALNGPDDAATSAASSSTRKQKLSNKQKKKLLDSADRAAGSLWRKSKAATLAGQQQASRKAAAQKKKKNKAKKARTPASSRTS